MANFVISISPSSVATKDGVITYTYTVAMDAVATVDEAIDFNIKGIGPNPASSKALSQYQPDTGTIVFKPGETIKTFDVKVAASAATQPDITFQVNLTSSLDWVTANPQQNSVISLVSTKPQNGGFILDEGKFYSVTPSARADLIFVTNRTLVGNQSIFKTLAGDDKVVVVDGGGIIELGDGDDTIKVENYSDKLNMDGGKGIDTLDLSMLNNFSPLSLNAQGEINLFQTWDNGFAFMGTAKGFEKIIGTNSSDTIATGKGLTMIDGGDGDDNIISNSGNDQLNGGDGDDSLAGAGGADMLTGGSGKDTFNFASIKDLNKAEQKTDVITDFKSGEDLLKLTFDHDSKTKGVQGGEFIGNSPFTKVAGQIRYYAAPSPEKFILVQGDTNGDGNLDWMIKLLGISTLTKEDFVNTFTN